MYFGLQERLCVIILAIIHRLRDLYAVGLAAVYSMVHTQWVAIMLTKLLTPAIM